MNLNARHSPRNVCWLWIILSTVLCATSIAQTGLPKTYTVTGGQADSMIWIDAAAFWNVGDGTTIDICDKVNAILTGRTSLTYPTNGAVIDARGFVSTAGLLTLRCRGDMFAGVTVPSVILLPAGTITIQATWTLPNNTRIIGEGENTSIAATGSAFSRHYMIEMGSSASCPQEGCSGVSVEHVQLTALGLSFVGGIHNGYSQTPSFVNDVNLFQIQGTGLKVDGANTSGAPGALDSGPYTNISFHADPGAGCTSATSCPVCADIEVQTRGLHGLTCLGSPKTYPQTFSAAVLVNASNNMHWHPEDPRPSWTV